jgi:hypothetical protein
MKTLIVLMILGSSVASAQESGGLLAQPYPGSVPETRPSVTDAVWREIYDARSRTYYSKDDAEKVTAHYAKLLGKNFESSPEGEHVRVLSVIPFNEVNGIVTKRGGSIGEGGDSFYGGTTAGVTVYGKSTASVPYSVFQAFDKLQKAYIQRFMDAENPDPTSLARHAEDPELKTAEQRYEHLKWSYFPEAAGKRSDGSAAPNSADWVVFDKYYTAPEAAHQKEIADVQKKLADASAAMKFEEAQKLSDRLMKLMQNDPAADWKTAVACLEEMDKNAYASKIVIDLHPSKWNLTLPNH